MWDDALVTDLRLVEMLRRLGATANFAISPGRHGPIRKTNDARGPYGDLVTHDELQEFAGFEISNHTAHHVELTTLTPEEMDREIADGRKMLEDLFQRAIDGFCYPYGRYNDAAVDILRREKYAYARTTNKDKPVDALLLHPSGKWDVDYESVVANATSVVFWGHTYELTDEGKWDKVRFLYEQLTQDSRVELVTFTELVRRRYGSVGRVRFL